MSDTQISVRQMARLLKKLTVRDGDILALKHQSANANQQAIEVIVSALTRSHINALVVVVQDFDDLAVLNEIEMNKRGWYRIEKMRRLHAPAIKPETPEIPEAEDVNEGQI